MLKKPQDEMLMSAPKNNGDISLIPNNEKKNPTQNPVHMVQEINFPRNSEYSETFSLIPEKISDEDMIIVIPIKASKV